MLHQQGVCVRVVVEVQLELAHALLGDRAVGAGDREQVAGCDVDVVALALDLVGALEQDLVEFLDGDVDVTVSMGGGEVQLPRGVNLTGARDRTIRPPGDADLSIRLTSSPQRSMRPRGQRHGLLPRPGSKHLASSGRLA